MNYFKFFGLIILCSFYVLNADVSYSDLENSNQYFIEDIDIDNDGVLDKVVSHKKYKGDALLFFKKFDKGYTLVYKGRNFSEDGGNIIQKIKPLNEKNGVMSVSTYFPDRGYLEKEYVIHYVNNSWYLNRVLIRTVDRLGDHTKTYLCSLIKNISLQKYDYDNILFLDQNFLKQCKVEFYSGKTLSEFISRFNDTFSKKVYANSARYVKLLNDFPLSPQTVALYKYIVLSLEKKELYEESLYLLKRIVQKFPEDKEANLWLDKTKKTSKKGN